MMSSGLIYNIQHFSLHDGPGIRTTVFFKGCNLACQWCHNPESISVKPILQYEAKNCIGCGACVAACPNGAHVTEENSHHVFMRKKCVGCGACVDVCFAGALNICGRLYSAEDVLKEVTRDKALYQKSGGGVTFSGGEPLLQADFIQQTAQVLQEEGVHIAIDSALNVPYLAVQKCLPYTDLFLVDFKLFDSDLHKRYTGATNERIKDNLTRLSKESVPIHVRVPIVKDVNDNEENHVKTAMFLSTLPNIEQMDLLSYHDLGVSKCTSFGFESVIFEAPNAKGMEVLKEIYEEVGLKVTVS